MVNQIFAIIFMTIPGIMYGVSLEYMMAIKKRGTNAVIRVLYWTVCFAITACVNILVSAGQDTHLFRAAFYWIFTGVALWRFYGDKVWKRIVAIIFLFFAMSLSEFSFVIGIQFEHIDAYVLSDRTNPLTVLMIGLGSLITCIACMILIILWKKMFRKGEKMRYLGAVILYSMNHYITLYIMVSSVWKKVLDSNAVGVVVLSVLCEMALLLVIFSQVEKETMLGQLDLEKRKNELEQVHYEEVRKSREKIGQVSSQSKKEVLKVKELLKENDLKQAEALLEQLAHQIAATKETMYCDIPVVNVILSEKQKMCEELNICLKMDIHIPSGIKVSQMELCSIFSNLMDNAIHAEKQLAVQNAEMQREIQLTTAVKGEYLVVKCKNPVGNPIVTVPERTGYGLKILDDIAKRHYGDFRTRSNHQIFEAQLTIKV